MWALTKICIFPRMYVPSEDRLIILHKSIRKRLCPFELVSQRKMRGPKEDNKFCRLTPWYTLDVPGSVTIIRQKKLLPRHGHICMTCKLENQPVRGVFLRKNFFFIKILKKFIRTYCRDWPRYVASETLSHLNYSKNL